MKITRRQFLKASGALAGYLLTGPSLWGGGALPAAYAGIGPKSGTETTSVCCFCGGGCGNIVTSSGGRVVAVEGDPASPINEGALCSKGQAAFQTANQRIPEELLRDTAVFAAGGTLASWPSGRRLARVLYRAPGATRWEVKDWDWALERIAQRVVDTRKNSWEAKAGEMVVNRTQAIAALGGAAHDNEECYLMQKLWRGLGLVYVEHQARI
jgi:formate dehydrogenase major subunit